MSAEDHLGGASCLADRLRGDCASPLSPAVCWLFAWLCFAAWQHRQLRRLTDHHTVPACHPSLPPLLHLYLHCRGAGAPHNSELARLGARTMLHMMLVDNLIHADLHPGNILGGCPRA